MKKYKILTVAPFFPPDKSGGLVNHIVNINTKLMEKGHDVTIIAPKHIADKRNLKSEKFKVHRINSIFLPGWPYSTLKSFSIPIDLGRNIDSIIKNGDFDIVHAHGHHFPISWKAIDSASKRGIPAILTLHGMWALNPNVLGGRSGWEEYFNKHKFKKILSKTNAVIGLTDKIINYAKKYESKPVKHYIIPNGVNTQKYQKNIQRKTEFRKKYGLNQSSKVIFFGSRFEDVKGIVEFVQVIKSFPQKNNVEFLIAGSGTKEKFVHETLQNLQNVHILGWQAPDIMHELYIASDVCVIPSKFEGLPLALMEAMNAGLHILYTEVGGIPDIIKDYKEKTLLSEVSVPLFRDMLLKIISKSDLKADEESLSYARQFDWENIVDKTCQVYQNVLGSNGNHE